MARLRPATAVDFRQYAGRDPDPAWCVEWWGDVVERDGIVIGIGLISRDEFNRYWAWTEMREPVSPFLLHRAVKARLAELAAMGAETVRCYCSDVLPSAPVWLRRLGFEPDPTLPAYKGRKVWLCNLSN